VSNFQGSGASYSFDVIPSGSNVSIGVSVAAGVAEDAATNTNEVSNTVNIQFNGTIVSATLAPVPTDDPTNDSPIQFTVTFGEAVTGVELTDLAVTNGTASNLQGSGASYTFDVTPTADGLVTVDLVAGAATGDVSGGSTAAATASITSDTTAPTASITAPAGPTNQDPIPFTITFSEDVTGLELTDLIVENGTASNLQGSGTTYTFDVAPIADGAVNVSIAADVVTDAAGNGNLAAGPGSTQSDKTSPTVAISTTATDPTHVSPIPITVTFNEDVTGFDADDLIVTNGTVSNFAGSGTTYTFDLTPTADGSITVNVSAGVAADLAGNANTAAPEFTITSIRTDAGMTDTLPDVNAPEWQDIGTEGLRFWDVQTGTGTGATTGSTITVFYTGWLLDGTVFDSARTTGAPITFTLQSGSLIEGWVQGLVGMQPGGIRRLYIPTALAYGNNPPPGSGIPQGADLVFEVKLVSVS
jgi:hypothetical protein